MASSPAVRPFSLVYQGATISESSPHEVPGRLDELHGLVKRAGTPERVSILEWGSGLSTILLSGEMKKRPDGFLLTIDHQAGWQRATLDACDKDDRIRAVVATLEGGKEPWCNYEVTYSTVPLHLHRLGIEEHSWDLIVIDGRRRMECALAACLVSGPDTLIALHDHQRLRYQHVRDICDVQTIGHYLVLKSKPKLRRT